MITVQNLTGYIKVVDLCDISINATDNLTGRLKNVSKTKVQKVDDVFYRLT